MFNFFASEENRRGSQYFIEGADYNHIKNVLRMGVGDTCLISCGGQSDLCEISDFADNSVVLNVIEVNYADTELPTKIYLFQGLPKGDKMEFIIQKSVELGAFCIVPVQMKNCVVKLDDKKAKAKVPRWQAIAESAAKQSKRNIIPQVCEVCSFDNALKKAAELDLVLVPYENEKGMAATTKALEKLKKAKSVGIFIGSEGGFTDTEIKKALDMGAEIISLGKRILRTETAAVTAVSMCMLSIELGGESNL